MMLPLNASVWKWSAKMSSLYCSTPFLFNDTIRANLTLGKPATDAALWNALTIAQLGDAVNDLEQGWIPLSDVTACDFPAVNGNAWPLRA